MGDLGLLSRVDDRGLVQLFHQRRDDPKVLEALNEELKQRDSDEAVDLHIEVAKARRALAKDTTMSPSPPSGPVREWLRTFLGNRSLTRPDGRPLYRYRMADSEYEEAKKLLRFLASSGRLREPDKRAGALFVAYCAEWFRRESDSTFLRWDDPAPDLFPNVPYASKQSLTTFGLDYWVRPLRRSAHAREYLLTVALEGGFPVRILAEGARSWLKEYLRAIMRRAIAWCADTHDEILAIAEEERGRMRMSYQHDDFVALCSELVERLLELRKTAEAEGAREIRNSALLDAKYPGWRDELPIYVPAEDEALVNELLSGLLDEKMTGLATEGVEARRYLVKSGGEWRPALQLLADGEIPLAKLPCVSALGRVRAIPSGELSTHLTGEVALLEPPVGDQRRWRVRPFLRTARLLKGFSFSAPVTTTLTSADGVPHPFMWPGGEALRSQVLVFEPDAGATPDEPLLRFLRAGSLSSPLKTLYVLVPDDWTVESATDGAAPEIESVPALGRKLVRLTATAYFWGDDESIRFRIEPDSEAREQYLHLQSVVPAGFVLADDRCELVAASAQPMVQEAKKQPRPPRPGELFVRRPGGKWTALAGPLTGAGLTELSWRDPLANIQIEKRQLALIPRDARVSGAMRGSVTGEIRLQGLSGWTATVKGQGCAVEQTDSSVFSIRFSGVPVYRLPVTLRPPAGEPFDVIVPLIGRDPVIARADGAVFPPNQPVDVRALRGAIVVAPTKAVIHLGAKGAKSGGINTVVDGELPLGFLRSAIDEMLATLPEQDDLVELDFIGDSRPPLRVSRYCHDQLSTSLGVVQWLPPSGRPGPFPVARMALDPRHEHALEYRGGNAWRIPNRCKGPCLVYLRDGVDVVSRPAVVVQPGSLPVYQGDLVSAVGVADFADRRSKILSALGRLGDGSGANDDLKWLLDAVGSLNGLPATALDALKLLPERPAAPIRLLFNARDASDRAAIWSLQNELPFLWLALPLSAWRMIVQSEYATVFHALQDVIGAERAAGESLARLARIRTELVAWEPGVDAIFAGSDLAAANAVDRPALDALVIAYITDRHDRGDEPPNDCAARLAAAGLKLHSAIAMKSHTHFAGLFAPVLLAASAQGRLQLDRDQALLVRRTMRENPAYVSQAFAHLLAFYGSPR